MFTTTTVPIVVGVSRRTGSPSAVRFAVREARIRETWVLAVTAWRPPRPPATSGIRPPSVAATTPDDPFKTETARIIASLTDTLDAPLETLGVDFELRRGSATTVLLQATKHAQLLVLDSPRSGDLSTVPKSWIAPAVIFRAHCPVVVTPNT